MSVRGEHFERSQHRSPARDRSRRAEGRDASTRRALAAGACVLAVLALGACAASRESTAAREPSASAPKRGVGQGATLRAIGGSAVTGLVRVVDRGEGATLTVAAFNLPIGEFRVAIQQTPNCTSPNGFSAGPAWAPPASKRKPADLVSVFLANASGIAQASEYVAGLRETGVNGVAGHSVVVYAGSRVTDARPDVPNERIACGVFEPVQPAQF